MSSGQSYGDQYKLDVLGQAELNKLNKEIDAAAEKLVNLKKGSAAYAQAQQDFNNVVAANAARMRELDKQLDSGTKGSKRFAAGVLEASRGAQDFAAAGIPGITNNIAQLAVAIGGGTGLIVALTGLAVALDVGYKNWDRIKNAFRETSDIAKLQDAFTVLTSLLEQSRDRMKELEKQKYLNVDEAREYMRLRIETLEVERKHTEEAEKQKNIKALAEGKTPEERDRAAAFKEAIGDQGAPVFRQIKELLESQERSDPTRRARQDALNRDTASTAAAIAALDAARFRAGGYESGEDQAKRLGLQQRLKAGREGQAAIAAEPQAAAEALINKAMQGDKRAQEELGRRAGSIQAVDDIENVLRTGSTQAALNAKGEANRLKIEAEQRKHAAQKRDELERAEWQAKEHEFAETDRAVDESIDRQRAGRRRVNSAEKSAREKEQRERQQEVNKAANQFDDAYALQAQDALLRGARTPQVGQAIARSLMATGSVTPDVAADVGMTIAEEQGKKLQAQLVELQQLGARKDYAQMMMLQRIGMMINNLRVNAMRSGVQSNTALPIVVSGGYR